MALIKAQNATFAYDGVNAVENLEFKINSGDYLCIIGENGSGKSTLIKGLLKLKSPVNGQVILGDGLKANEIGYLPQQSEHHKNFPASILEVVMSGRLNSLRFKPFYNKSDKKIALKNLSLMDMEKWAHKSYQELSGGQRQRVLLARALCATKKLILLDEPVSGLDPIATKELYSLIKKINNDGITVVMVSHDINSCMEYASHILHLSKEQLFFGTAIEYEKSEIGEHFLGGCNDAS